MHEQFREALPIIDKLEENGYNAFFVGGAVRDVILGRDIKDIDIATSALPHQILELFPKTIDVGAEHGTIVVIHKESSYEVTTFRQDEEYKDFRRPASVVFIDSLIEDLKRRDFTMNAMAMTKDGHIIDPFLGQQAILNREIITVGKPEDRFHEDALRMLRAIRFCAQLSFNLAERTIQAIIKHAALLKHVSIERISTEFEKILAGINASAAIKLMFETTLIKYMPCINSDINVDTFIHIKWEQLTTATERWTMFVYLLDLEDVKMCLKKWKLPMKVIRSVSSNIHYLTKDGAWTNKTLYDAGLETVLEVERIRAIHGELDPEPHLAAFRSQFAALPIHNKKQIAVTGHDVAEWLQIERGPAIGEWLANIELQILNGQLENTKVAVREWLIKCKQTSVKHY
ncbi:CCA tRNA nucleotidyltransferase [Bacillus sp. HMF5848]|uniref:CCA tRNA nucleotidyltransferase n=1 Tax=Bacillus sp. HMF5848 TaxID=2495421 RepID=UPI0021ADC41B|nr:CCA tRNA nucleotidyltransferase [Bacillus sp. HMF5848]